MRLYSPYGLLGDRAKQLRCTILYIANKPKGCFVSRRFVSTDVLSLWTFCLPDVLSLRKFYLYGRFVSTDVLSHRRYVFGCFVSGRFVSGRFVPTDVLSPDVLSLWTFSLRMFFLGTGLPTVHQLTIHFMKLIFFHLHIKKDKQPHGDEIVPVLFFY